MSSERYGDIDLVFWLGRSINAMTREELQVALGEAIMQIEHLKRDLHITDAYIKLAEAKIRLYAHNQKSHSRFTNPEYIASFC